MDELEHIQCIREAIGAMDTGKTIAIMRSAARLREIVNSTIAAEAREMQNVPGPSYEPQSPSPTGGGPIDERKTQALAMDQAPIDIPCPYAWAERYLDDSKDREPRTHSPNESQLDQVYANIAQTINDIADKSSTHHPIGMGSKHPKHLTYQEEHHKGSEQHVPQFIVENLSFMAMATCQFTAKARNRNNKEFLALLDMVERLHDTSPDSNSGHYHCCGHCIDDCVTGQWVVLLSCGHVHHHECHHAATKNKVFYTCPSCGKNQTSSQTTLQARCPSPQGPTILCLGAKCEAIPDMTTIARAHRCTPTLIFIAASQRHHDHKGLRDNDMQLQTTWGCAMQIPGIWIGCIGSFSAPTDMCNRQCYNIYALRTRTDPGSTNSAVWITTDGPMCARLSNLGLWEQNGHGEPVNTPQIVSRWRDIFSTTIQMTGNASRTQATTWAMKVREANKAEANNTQSLGAWTLTLADAQNSILFRIHNSWKQEIIAAIEGFEEEDIDGHSRVQIKCAFYGSTMILAAGQCDQEIYVCSSICKLVTQIMTRHEASDELIRHGHIRLSDWHTTGPQILVDHTHHLDRIAACKKKGPAELTHNLAGWLWVAHALTHAQQEDKEKEQTKAVQFRHQAPPGLTLKGEDKGVEGQQAANSKTLSSNSPNQLLAPRNSAHNICQPGINHTLSRSGYTPVLTRARAVDASTRTQTAGVGAHIYGMDGKHWGKVVAGEHSAWRLAGGRIAKRKTEEINWEWGRKHASDFPDNPDENTGTDSPQPDYPFSPFQEHAHADSKAVNLSTPTHQTPRHHSNYTHKSNIPDTDATHNSLPGILRTNGNDKYPRASDRNSGDTAKEVTIWWHVEVAAHEAPRKNIPDTVTVTSYPTSLAVLKQKVCAKKGLDGRIFYIVSHYQKQREIDAGKSTVGVTMQCRGFGGARTTHHPDKGHPIGTHHNPEHLKLTRS